MFLQFLPELLQRLPRLAGVRALGVTRRKLHIVVDADRRKRRVEIPRLHIRRHEGEDVGIAHCASAGDEIAPRTLAQLQILHLVQIGEARRHTRLDGTLTQQPRAERMNRPGEEALEIRERRLDARDAFGVRRRARTRIASLRQLGFEREMEPAAQLGGRLARERHRRQLLHLIHAGGNASGHALGEHLCFAGTCTGFDEDVRQQLFADQPTRFLIIDTRLRHRRQASGTHRVWNAEVSRPPACSRFRRTPRHNRNTCSCPHQAFERTVL